MFFKWNLSPRHLILNDNIDIFWYNVLFAWCHYKYYNPVKFKEIVSQPLWFNSHILVDGQPIYSKNLFESNMIYIGNIINPDGSFMNYDQILQKFNPGSFLIYFSIVYAIPQEWKFTIKQNMDCQSVVLLSNPCDLLLNNFLKSKRVWNCCYPYFVKNHKTTLSETDHQVKWETDLLLTLQDSLLWKSRFSLIYRSSIENRIRNFQFKFVHRKIATQYYLCKIGISDSALCNFCDSHPQTLLHLFLKCTHVSSFWYEVFLWLKAKKARNVMFTDEEICCWTLQVERGHFVNTFIYYAKYFIFSCKIKNIIPSPFLFSMKHLENTERIIAMKKNRLDFHVSKWQALIP